MQTGSGGERPDPAFSITALLRGREVVVEFTQHASDRMRDRGVTVDAVLACLRTPDCRGLAADDGRQRDGRHGTDGRRLDVVYEIQPGSGSPDVLTVVSTFWVSGRRG
jgi:hypothetical protein